MLFLVYIWEMSLFDEFPMNINLWKIARKKQWSIGNIPTNNPSMFSIVSRCCRKNTHRKIRQTFSNRSVSWKSVGNAFKRIILFLTYIQVVEQVKIRELHISCHLQDLVLQRSQSYQSTSQPLNCSYSLCMFHWKLILRKFLINKTDLTLLAVFHEC